MALLFSRAVQQFPLISANLAGISHHRTLTNAKKKHLAIHDVFGGTKGTLLNESNYEPNRVENTGVM